MATTIRVSEELKRELEKLKKYPHESYESVIWDLLEVLSEETKRELEEAYRDMEEGRIYSHDVHLISHVFSPFMRQGKVKRASCNRAEK